MRNFLYFWVVVFNLTFLNAQDVYKVLIDDIQNFHKDHVKRFESLTTLAFSSSITRRNDIYSDNPVPYAVEKEAIKLLLGYHGLNRKRKSENRYLNQMQWALEFIIRRSGKENDILPLLRDVLTTMKKKGKEINLQHVSWVVFYFLNAKFDVDQEFYWEPKIKLNRFDFLRDKEEYFELGDFKEDIYTYIIQNRISTEVSLNAQLESVNYLNTRDDIFRFMKMKPTGSNPEGKKGFTSKINFNPKTVGLGQNIFKEITWDFKDQEAKSLKKSFQAEIKGHLKNVPGDGSCFYHAVRDHAHPIDFQENAQLNQILSRTFLADKIQEKMKDPLVRYYLSQAIGFYYLNPKFNLWHPKEWFLEDSWQSYNNPLLLANDLYQLSKIDEGYFFQSFLNDKIININVLGEYALTEAFELLSAYLNDYAELYLFELEGNSLRLTIANRLFPKGKDKKDNLALLGDNDHYFHINKLTSVLKPDLTAKPYL